MTAVLTAELSLPAETGDISLEDACAGARVIGAEHGRNAASWCFDGNTVDAVYRVVARGLADVDPLVMDAFTEPALGAEYDARALCDDLDIDHEATDASEVDTIAEAWREAASEAFWQEIERIVAAHLA